MSAGWTSTRSSKPLVSTRICRLRPFTFFSGVIPTIAACFCGFDALVINHCIPGFAVAPELVAQHLAQAFIDAFPGAVVPPFVKVVAHRAMGWKVVGQHPPLATRPI